MNGLFFIGRSIFDDTKQFKDEPFTEREAWMWMVGSAAWKPEKVTVKGVIIHLNRGQLSHSTRFMATKWQWSESKVRRFIKRRKNDAAIDAVSDAGQLVITICNYERFQNPSKKVTQQVTQKATEERRKDKEIINTLPSEEARTPSNDSLDKLLYQRGKDVLGPKAGGQVTKLKNAVGVGKALEVIEISTSKQNPAEYIAGAIRNNTNDKTKRQMIPGGKVSRRAAIEMQIPDDAPKEWADEFRKEHGLTTQH
jgi:hypothetical protein